jgi:IclR family KDG regulon transcriptional repressor
MRAMSDVAAARMTGSTRARPWLHSVGGGSNEAPLGAVEKADLVLGSFPSDRADVGVTELSRRCGLAKSTTHRILQVLEAIGMVVHVPTGYRLGHRLHELADIASGQCTSRIRDRVLPYLLDLYEQTHLTVHLGVWADSEILIADRLHGRNGPCVPPPVGAKLMAQSHALGKVLLAYADEPARWQASAQAAARRAERITLPALEEELSVIRQRGIAVSSGQFLPGIGCIAAPIWGTRRSAVAAVCVSGPLKRLEANDAGRHVRRAAHAASLARPGGQRERAGSARGLSGRAPRQLGAAAKRA